MEKKDFFAEALSNLRPSASWVIYGDSKYENLVWDDLKQTKPTESEINTEASRLQSDYDAKEYQRQRAPEYPSIGDQLDALWKGGDAAAEMLAKVQAVKTKYPKP